MKNFLRKLEKYFEKLTAGATTMLGDPITFFFALCTVVFWITNKQFYDHSIHERIGDLIMAITFLSLFIIQKSFNRFSATLHLKVNELVVSHENANNAVLNVETKTEHEIQELLKEYDEVIEKIEEISESLESHEKEKEKAAEK